MQDAINQANERLRANRYRVRIEQRRQRLYLRATLPSPEAGQPPRQQRVALGIEAQPGRIHEAEAQAARLHFEVVTGSFEWGRWREAPNPESVEVVTKGLTRDAVHTRTSDWVYQRSSSPERAALLMSKTYTPAIRKLPEAGITLDTLVDVLNTLPPKHAGRDRAVCVYRRIAELCKWDLALLPKVSFPTMQQQLTPRSLLTDKEIEEVYEMLNPPHWRWVWGMLATYGLRPHEVLDAELQNDESLIISSYTKTGARVVWPCPSEWVDRFNLRTRHEPTTEPRAISKIMNGYLKRKNIKVGGLYNLRHAYAVRLLLAGVPADIGSRLMGHSLAMHVNTYRRWTEAAHLNSIRDRFDLRQVQDRTG